MDPFSTDLFGEIYGKSPIPKVLDALEQGIGAYELLSAGERLDLPTTPEPIDVIGAIRRALRPHFRAGPPERERDVQDAIETILQSIGIAYTREQESAPVGPRAFKPDFVLTDADTAVEVKFTRGTFTASALQEEIAADISGYRTQWARLIVIVYDCGVISDPDALQRANMTHFGVVVEVVKH